MSPLDEGIMVIIDRLKKHLSDSIVKEFGYIIKGRNETYGPKVLNAGSSCLLWNEVIKVELRSFEIFPFKEILVEGRSNPIR